MKASKWFNLIVVEACWAALAYYIGDTWTERLIGFLFLNTLLIWGWRKSRAKL